MTPIAKEKLSEWVDKLASGIPLAVIAEQEGRDARTLRKFLAYRGLPTTVEKAQAAKEGWPARKRQRSTRVDRRPAREIESRPAAWPMPVSFVFDLGRAMR